jgi:hypothetical protein
MRITWFCRSPVVKLWVTTGGTAARSMVESRFVPNSCPTTASEPSALTSTEVGAAAVGRSATTAPVATA